MVRINVLCSPETVGVVWCGVVSLEEYLEIIIIINIIIIIIEGHHSHWVNTSTQTFTLDSSSGRHFKY